MHIGSNRGYTLIQVAMGLGMVALLAVISASVMNQNMSAIRGVANIQSATIVGREVRLLLQKQDVCTGNLKGQAVVLNQPILLPKIDSYDSAGVKGAVVFDPNTNDFLSSVKVDSISVLPKVQVSPTNYIGEVVLNFETKTQAAGAQRFFRQFPISIEVDAGNTIVECGAVGRGSLNEASICSASGGTFDAATKACVVIPTGTTDDGNLGPHALKAGQVWHCATAPIGSKTVDCSIHMRPGDPNPEKQPDLPGWVVEDGEEVITLHGLCVNGVDPGVKNSVSRVYTNGQTMKKNPPPFILKNVAGTKAECVWANDLTPGQIATMGCGAWCTRFVSGP